MIFAKTLIVFLLAIAALISGVASSTDEGDLMLDQVRSYFRNCGLGNIGVCVCSHRYRESQCQTVLLLQCVMYSVREGTRCVHSVLFSLAP
jgi:hypothetical protein